MTVQVNLARSRTNLHPGCWLGQIRFKICGSQDPIPGRKFGCRLDPEIKVKIWRYSSADCELPVLLGCVVALCEEFYLSRSAREYVFDFFVRVDPESRQFVVDRTGNVVDNVFYRFFFLGSR